MNRIDYLILSSSFDYSTDLVCFRLYEKKQKYYRLNRDEFKNHKITLSLNDKRMYIEYDKLSFFAEFENLKAVYFRAPVFLRTQTKRILTVEEQLERNQWSSFIRNLSVFVNSKWINSPYDTYLAENKLLQLYFAQKTGLLVPETVVTNSFNPTHLMREKYIVKSLDTALFYDFEKNNEMFTYSCVIDNDDLIQRDISQAPVIIQEYVENKVDCRVTYVDGKVFPVRILSGGHGVEGDWRKQKNGLQYKEFELPSKINNHLKRFMKALNLKFGGIDLMESNGKYYFVEVNPTGEWGWLETGTGIKISEEIAKAMTR